VVLVKPHIVTRLLGALALGFAALQPARAALWVSPGGDDANPGTEEQPLRTLARARDMVRTLNRDMADDLTVFISGDLHLDLPLELGPEDSGTNGFNVIYTAAPGEHPVLSHGFRLAGWTLADKERNLWVAPAPKGLVDTLSLYVNGTPANRTHGRMLQVFSKSIAGAPLAPMDPRAQWKNPGDVVFAPPGGGAIWSEAAATAPLFIENAFELLGMPGEWYFDRPAGLFYYTPRVGEEMTTAEVVAASPGALLTGRGSKGRPIAGLIFKGLGFEFTAASNPSEASPEGSVSRDAAAAVSFSNASGIQFLEDQFLHMSTPALELGPAVLGATVDGCLFGEIGWSALRVSDSSQVRVAESLFSYVSMERTGRGAIEVDRSEDVSVEGNQVDHYPSEAVRVLGGRAGAVRESSNWVAQPMIGFHGGRPDAPSAEPAGTGLPAAYRSLLDVRFRALTTPRPPSHVSAEAVDTAAYVTWIPSCQDGGAPVLYYTVSSSTGATLVVPAGDFQAKGYVVFTELENGHGVTFAVSAANRVGSSPPSPPTANVTPGHRKRLKAPQSPAWERLSQGAEGATVRISPPGSDGGSPVVAYVVAPAPGGPKTVLEGLDVIHCDPAHPLVRTVEGLVLGPGSTVAARTAAGEGPPAAAGPRR